MVRVDTLLPRPVRAVPAPGVHTVTDHRAVLDPTTVVVDPRASPEDGSYRLTITPDRLHAVAHDATGAYHATQTLRQLLGPDAFRAADLHTGRWELPCGEITDYPRYRWRGCLLDVARHFMPTAAVLRFVDLLAAHKLNVLHLHLTDDQGWRVEVPGLPRLTEVGAWRAGSWVGRRPDSDPTHDGRPHGGFYTTDDLREIVAHARSRHVTVVPEIDVPGHSQAAIAAYPELGTPGDPPEVWHAWGISDRVLDPSERTLGFYRRVLDHVVSVFDSPVIALGGDEVPTTRWSADPTIRRRAADLGLPSADALRGWFVGELAGHLAVHGRQALVWDDLRPLPENTVIGAWSGRPVPPGHDVVMCPETHLYLDHRQSDHPDEPIPVGYLRTVEDVYAYEPGDVLGAQAMVWTEHLDSPRRVDYAAFPRLAAFAEVVWSPAGRDPAFPRRLVEHHLPRLAALGVEYRPPTGPRPWQRRPGVPGRPR